MRKRVSSSRGKGKFAVGIDYGTESGRAAGDPGAKDVVRRLKALQAEQAAE